MHADIRAAVSRQLSNIISLPADTIKNLLEIPPSPELGDFALPCFVLARELKKNPNQIAEDLAQQLSSDDAARAAESILSRAESKGAYLNIFIDRSCAAQQILSSLFEDDFTHLQSTGRGKTVLIDFSSPNIAKPFGIGHLRSTVIGNSLKKIYEFLGYRVIGINHLGDWGTQFGKLITAFKHWGSRDELKSGEPISYLYRLYVEFHARAEKDPELEDEAREWFSRLENRDTEALDLWEEFRDLSIAEFRRIYDRLGVQFEHYTGESSYSDRLDEAIDVVSKSGITRLSDNALIVPFEDGDLPPALLRKSDGATLYITRDLAAAFYRWEHFQFDLALYVVGTPQSLHFRQMFKILETMGLPWYSRCVHVQFGQIRFKDGSMSTRKGNIIFLEDVLNRAVQLALDTIREKNPDLDNREKIAESVGVGAVIFNDLKNYRVRDINFDWDEVMNFNGETGVYLQYTHARMCSLLRKYMQQYGEIRREDGAPAVEESFAVATQLNEFEEIVRKAALDCEPSIIARYLLELASQFNSFYNQYRVITDDAKLSSSRVLVVSGVRKVMKQGLELLGIEAVEEM
jgi:arginyl-tRNA synthetase